MRSEVEVSSECSVAASIACEAEGILREAGTLHNSYVQDLVSGAMSLEEFRRSQEQFYFAVTNFARPMAALVSRIPEPGRRLEILHNLVEEHGDFDRARFHATTFRDFLRAIGASDDPDRDREIGCEVDAFNRVLDGACRDGDLDEAVACLGVIEFAFADISAMIGGAVLDRGWLAPEELTHYGLHAEIDRRHASEFFAVVAVPWEDARGRSRVRRGLRLGAYAFERLYRDLVRKG